jgi:RNA polymerase sigma-70 factor (ECF subfamily)
VSAGDGFGRAVPTERERAAGTADRTPAPGGSPATGERFARAFNEMRDELVGTLFHLLGNYEDAEDAAQEAFLKCWRRRDHLHKVQNLRAWIFQVARNAAKDFRRNPWRRRARLLTSAQAGRPGTGDSPVHTLEVCEAKERLRAALMVLRPEEKEVFLLRQDGFLTYAEIASLRRSPVGTIKTQMRIALRKLRQVLAGT